MKSSKDPKFLALDEVIEIHQDHVRRSGGSPEIRDVGLLESAVAMPAAQFGGQFLHADLCEMAAAYLFHIAKNHPFVDGNKRTAATAADVFLTLNGLDLQADEKVFEAIVLSVAEGEADKASIAKFFRQNIQKQA